MLVSYRWLCELLPGLELAPEELARRLSLAGLTVDSVRHVGTALDQVFVAEVRRVERHPDRSKLSLVTVSRGDAEQRVVCGAPNVPAPGGRVALAMVGARLPAFDAPLAPRTIAGIESHGMLCSEVELGLSDASDGILILPADAPVGASVADAMPYAVDTIFELDVTPNRPDALGHVGIARDVAALLGLPFSPPAAGTPKRLSDAKLSDLVTIENLDLERCPQYGAAAVVDVKVGPSPAWLRYRLSSLGVRPISNVVDITNLLLLEYAQPMHAFDLERVRDRRIVVRRARAGEVFKTLDGVARSLEADDLVICDGEGPTALAGVMGGEDSEIKPTTNTVLLECAFFQARGVRRTSRRHGLHTESSHRFERGVDRGQVPHVLERAVVLLTELAGGAAVPGALHREAPQPTMVQIPLRAARLSALLGVAVDFGEVLGILDRLGLRTVSRSEDGEQALVSGASHRPDIAIEADLIEEVARIRGLDEIPTRLPAIVPQPPRSTGELERDAADIAAGLGLSEALTYAFVSEQQLTALSAPAPSVVLQNPLTEERSVMRTSLLPGLLETVRRSRRRGENSLRLFTVGARFLAPLEGEQAARSRAARPAMDGDRGVLPEERPSFAAVLAGPRPAHLCIKAEDYDVFDAKGVAVEMAERLSQTEAEVKPAGDDPTCRHLHPRGRGLVLVEGVRVGVFGPLHPDIVDALDLDGPVQIVEMDLAAFESLELKVPRHRPIPRLPAIRRDLSFVVREEVNAGDVAALIAGSAGELCESVEIVADFRGASVPAGCRSITFRVTYRDPKAATDPDKARTLTDKEVDSVQDDIIRSTSQKLGAELRG